MTAAGGLALAAGIALAARLIEPGGPLGRFSWDYLAFLLSVFLTAPHPAFWQAVFGPLISPGKSIFLYSPVLLLALASLVIEGRMRWREFLAPWLTLLGLIIAQALFYDDQWWGQVNWGLRFLLPALPLLIVAAAPAVERLLACCSPAIRRAVWALVGASVLVQVEAILLPTRAYYVSLLGLGLEAAGTLGIWNPSHSALVGHWRLLFEGAQWDLAAVRAASSNPVGVSLLTGGLALLATGAALGLWVALRRDLPKWAAVGISAAALLVAALLPPGLLRTYQRDPAYFAEREAFRAATGFVNAQAAPGDVIVVQAYGMPLWHFFLNYARPPVEWFSLPLHFPTGAELEAIRLTGDPSPGLNPATLALLAELPSRFERLWLVNALDAPPGDLQLEEKWLKARYRTLGEWTFPEAGRVAVALFAMTDRPASEANARRSAN